MIRSGKILSIITVLSLGVAGCNKTEEDKTVRVMKTPAQAATVMEQVFKNAEPNAKQNIQVAVTALQKQDYEVAVVALQTLQGQMVTRTFDQSQVLAQSMRVLQSSIIKGVENGDPKAIRAAEVLKGRHRK